MSQYPILLNRAAQGHTIAWLCAVALLLTGSASTTAAAAAADVGQPAPALRVQLLGGPALELTALRGKVVVLNFWATWCTPCRAEMPMLETFYRQHKAEGLELIGLSDDDLHDRRDVERVMRAFSYPAALLQEAKVNGFGLPGVLPISYVIDANGVIRARLMPTRAGLSEKDLAAAVLPLLARAAGAPP
jgi:thiol-disulfide isomerase/thioredoxin